METQDACTRARDHLAGIGMLADCPGCDDPAIRWYGGDEDLDEAREAAGLPPRDRLDHALQWGRHAFWQLGQEEEVLVPDLVDFERWPLVLADPGCVKRDVVEKILSKINPTCGQKGCLDHGNGPIAPTDLSTVPRWTGTVSTDPVDDSTVVFFTVHASDVTWTLVDDLLLRIVWLDQDQAVAERRSPDHRCYQQGLRRVVQELHDQGDGTLVVRHQHGTIVCKGSLRPAQRT